MLKWADGNTIICRCEEITRMEIEEALDQGARTLDDIKRLTRCGMGICQWKACKTSVLEILKDKEPDSIQSDTIRNGSHLLNPRIRIPLSPIRIDKLANMGERP